MKSENEKKLNALIEIYDERIKKFNDGHRELKHLKQSNYRLSKRIDELVKIVKTEKDAG